MTALTAPYLFTEARLNIEPTYPNSTFHIPTQAASLSSPRKRLRLGEESEKDEEAFTRQHIATESSIFFRRKTRSPRSFLWRVLDERKVLELQCVDLVQPKRARQESLLTYSLTFANPIRPNGIAFADPDEHDALEVFVLTTGNELFTFTLRRDLLVKSSPPLSTDLEPSNFFKLYTPSSFTFRYPYKLVATSSLELLVSLHDGGLLRLERRAGESGSSWRETFFSEGGWGSSFRGLIPWKGHNTVRHGNIDLEPSSAVAIESAPDNEHVFTISLDHTLKAWNKKTGKIGVQTDILGENYKEPQVAARFLISPNEDCLMRVVEVHGQPDGDIYYVVTNSPRDHQFKFWAIRDADSLAHGLRDVQPDVRLVPPLDDLMNTNVWQLVDFHLKPGTGWHETQIWVRARSGATCKIFTLTFSLLASPEDLEDSWRTNWAAVDDGSLDIERLVSGQDFPQDQHSQSSNLDSQSMTDKWLDFLFYPGRFTISTLDTALYMYRKGFGLLTATSRSAEAGKPLKELLCSAVSSKVKIRHSNNGQPDLERYQSDVAAQWHVFFGLIRHLHQKRADSLSLSFDVDNLMPWSIRADQVAPVRTCSEMEILRYNAAIFTTQDEEWINNSLPLANWLSSESSVPEARLLAAARSFRANLSAAFSQKFRTASAYQALEVWSDDQPTDKDALQMLYDRCGLASEVSDDDFNRLTDSLQGIGGLGYLENDLVLSAVEYLAENHRGFDDEQALTRCGDKTTIRCAQEILTTGHEVLQDLLALVVFVSQDLEPDELSPGFKPNEIYSSLVSKLKEYNILLWLAATVRQETPAKPAGSTSDASQLSKTPTQPTLTLFESIFIGDWQSIRSPDDTLPALITHWCRAWTFGPSLSTSYDGVTAHIMANLLKHGDYGLAMDFVRFLPDNVWTTYLKARLHLDISEYAYAAEYFRQASTGLSESKTVNVESLDTAGLLSDTSVQLFADGLSRYYLHVSSLFEAAKIQSYTAEFALLALQHLSDENEDINDTSMMDLDTRKRSMHGSPAATRVDLAIEEIRLLRVQELKEDILGRLFNASLQTGRHQQAFEALVQFGNPVLRKASLQSLLQAILTTSQSSSTLLSLSFPAPIVPEVDAILLSLARKHLASSASASSVPTPQYHAVLYAWRIQHDDFRGAAEILWQRLQQLKAHDGRSFQEADESLLDAYLVLINTLACCGDDEGWILAEAGGGGSGEHGGGNHGAGAEKDDAVKAQVKLAKRKIVTLEDVRRQYQAELDRRSEMLQGRFALVGSADEMDVL